MEQVLGQQGRLEDYLAPVEGASLEQEPVCWGRLGDCLAPVGEAGVEVLVKWGRLGDCQAPV